MDLLLVQTIRAPAARKSTRVGTPITQNWVTSL
jgi:hypothetical protein